MKNIILFIATIALSASTVMAQQKQAQPNSEQQSTARQNQTDPPRQDVTGIFIQGVIDTVGDLALRSSATQDKAKLLRALDLVESLNPYVGKDTLANRMYYPYKAAVLSRMVSSGVFDKDSTAMFGKEAIRMYDVCIEKRLGDLLFSCTDAGALAYDILGNADLCIDYLDKAIALNPKNANSYMLKVQYLAKMNRLNEACATLKKMKDSKMSMGANEVDNLFLYYECDKYLPKE